LSFLDSGSPNAAWRFWRIGFQEIETGEDAADGVDIHLDDANGAIDEIFVGADRYDISRGDLVDAAGKLRPEERHGTLTSTGLRSRRGRRLSPGNGSNQHDQKEGEAKHFRSVLIWTACVQQCSGCELEDYYRLADPLCAPKLAPLSFMRFANQVAIVTGAGRGIGNAIALRLASEGCRVAVVSRTEQNANKTAEEINARYAGLAKAYAVDVADHPGVKTLADRILGEFSRIDILVNNAGLTRDGLSMRMSEADWDIVIDTNLKGAFNFIQACERPMMKQRHGRIINIASVAGLMGNAGQANYAASKAGLIGLTKTIARELASRSITCNAVAPGFITTDMTDVLSQEIKDTVVKNIPLGRFGESDDIAGAVAFLASGEAKYITGQVLTVDGGMVM
jgi:3-oxoacyl-[acyl-carrier protein] reductase